jgi:hypothetical protein
MEKGQFEEWLSDYEAELGEGVQKRVGLTDGISEKQRPRDELQEKDQGKLPTSQLPQSVQGKSGQVP